MAVTAPRSWGAAFIIALLPAVAIGIAESLLSEMEIRAGLDDLLHAVALHAAGAALVCLPFALIRRRAPAARAGRLALAAVLAFEGAVVGAYWLGTLTGFPRFFQLQGKILTGAAVVGGLLLGAWLGHALAKRIPPRTWERLAGGPAGPAGFALWALLLLSAGGFLVLARPREPEVTVREDADSLARPDVVVILVDTLRRDHLGYFGYERPTTPRLTELFDQSYVFTQAWTPSTWTSPSVTSLFTGLYPTTHGVVTVYHGIPQSLPTLAEHFRSYGYRTGAFVANQLLTARNGYSQGFETFYPPEPPTWCRESRTAFGRAVTRIIRPDMVGAGWRLNSEARKWLDRDDDRPRFLYVHYFEPHSDYVPPAKHRDAVAPGVGPGPANPPMFAQHREALGGVDCNDWECLPDRPVMSAEDLAGMIANYDGEVHYVDHAAGVLLRFLREFGVYDDAHIVFCTDHGEEFFDHTGWFHGNSIYEEMIGCPLTYRPPGGLPEPVVIDRPVAQIDLVRTLFPLIGIEASPFHQGREIPELLGQPAPRPAPPALAELPPYLYALRHGDWKLIRRGPRNDPDWRLYNLADDPRELHDLAAAQPDTLRMMRGWLEDLLATHARSAAQPGEISEDPEMLRRLRDLGYIK